MRLRGSLVRDVLGLLVGVSVGVVLWEEMEGTVIPALHIRLVDRSAYEQA